ncbi:MAG: hypothetical protein JW940_00540 [Polyangiaceae bacterium]|nr:hypothetical protein [Polyangiaceae bacterium]
MTPFRTWAWRADFPNDSAPVIWNVTQTCRASLAPLSLVVRRAVLPCR